jgi:hypothetical protein
MLTSVALVVCQVKVVDDPVSTVSGLALKVAVGAAAGGGGGGGGGGVFLWQAPKNIMAPNTNMSEIHFILCCFTYPPCNIAPFCTPARLNAGLAELKSAFPGLVNRKTRQT